MHVPNELPGFDDEAIRGELIRLLDREETRLSQEMRDNLAKSQKEADALGSEARAIWDGVENKIRDRGVLVFETMRDYVRRSR